LSLPQEVNAKVTIATAKTVLIAFFILVWFENINNSLFIPGI
jgi:hypothetical protein